MGKMKLIYFSKTIAAYDLKVSRCIELNDLINLHDIQRSRSFFDLCQRSLFSNINIFVSKTVEIFETKYHVKDFGSTEMKIYTKWAWSHDQDGCHAHIWLKPFKIFLSRASGQIAMKLCM